MYYSIGLTSAVLLFGGFNILLFTVTCLDLFMFVLVFTIDNLSYFLKFYTGEGEFEF